MVSKFTRGMFDRNPLRNSGIRAGLRRRDAYQRRNCNTDLVENFKMMSVGETRPRYNNRTRKPRCYTCRRRGHTYRNCQSNQYTTDPREETVDIDQTSNREEHVQKYSDKVAVKGDYLVHGTEHGDWNNIWFVSDKYSKHMTPNRNIFVQFKRCFVAATKEHDSNFLFTHGIGEVEVDTNNRTYVVPSVSYVPEIGINLLSMKQLSCQGFEIDIDGSNCTIRRMFNEKYDEMTGEEVLENQDNYLHHYFEELEKNTTQNDEGNTVGEELSKDGPSEQKGDLELTELTFEGFTRFMKLANNNAVALKNKDVFRECFDSMLKWFHESYIEGEIAKNIPPLIIGLEICIFDLYKLIKCLGGYDRVTRKNKWPEVAMGFGFPDVYELKFKEIYVNYLLIPDTYFEVAKEGMTNPEDYIIEGWNEESTRSMRDTSRSVDQLGQPCCSNSGSNHGTQQVESKTQEENNTKASGNQSKDSDDFIIIT